MELLHAPGIGDLSTVSHVKFDCRDLGCKDPKQSGNIANVFVLYV